MLPRPLPKGAGELREVALCCPAPTPLHKEAGEFGCVPGQAMVRPGDRTSLKSPAP